MDKMVSTDGCHYCEDEECPELDWVYGLDHLLPNYKFCPMCGRRICGAADEPPALDELQRLAGQPVWITSLGIGAEGEWMLVAKVDSEHIHLVNRIADHDALALTTYGKCWAAYRRPQKEVKP